MINLKVNFLSRTLIENGYIKKSYVKVFNNGIKYTKGDSIKYNPSNDSILKIYYRRKFKFILNNNCVKSINTNIVISQIKHKKSFLNFLNINSLYKHNYVMTISFFKNPSTQTSFIIKKKKINKICFD